MKKAKVLVKTHLYTATLHQGSWPVEYFESKSLKKLQRKVKQHCDTQILEVHRKAGLKYWLRTYKETISTVQLNDRILKLS